MDTNEKIIMDAIEQTTLKASYKMKQALLRIAKKATPIERVEFFIESMPENQHGKGYADGVEVFYKYTSNRYTIVNFDGEIFQMP